MREPQQNPGENKNTQSTEKHARTLTLPASGALLNTNYQHHTVCVLKSPLREAADSKQEHGGRGAQQNVHSE